MTQNTTRPDDGGPAFPLGSELTWPGHDRHGASLWDFYAAHALGMALALQSGGGPPSLPEIAAAAVDAATVADAMLAERAKRWPVGG